MLVTEALVTLLVTMTWFVHKRRMGVKVVWAATLYRP